jgi:hypothetical protein
VNGDEYLLLANKRQYFIVADCLIERDLTPSLLRRKPGCGKAKKSKKSQVDDANHPWKRCCLKIDAVGHQAIERLMSFSPVKEDDYCPAANKREYLPVVDCPWDSSWFGRNLLSTHSPITKATLIELVTPLRTP